MFLITVGPSFDKRRQLERPKGKLKRSENPLHQCQMESGVGLIASKSMPANNRKEGPGHCRARATSETVPSATTRGATCCETPRRLRQIRPAPPQFERRSSGLHLVPSLWIR